jgi:TPR repeat protein
MATKPTLSSIVSISCPRVSSARHSWAAQFIEPPNQSIVANERVAVWGRMSLSMMYMERFTRHNDQGGEPDTALHNYKQRHTFDSEGDVTAQFNSGFCLRNGEGVRIDFN